MFRWAIIFAVIALIASLLGFGGVAGLSKDFAVILWWLPLFWQSLVSCPEAKSSKYIIKNKKRRIPVFFFFIDKNHVSIISLQANCYFYV